MSVFIVSSIESGTLELKNCAVKASPESQCAYINVKKKKSNDKIFCLKHYQDVLLPFHQSHCCESPTRLSSWDKGKTRLDNFQYG